MNHRRLATTECRSRSWHRGSRIGSSCPGWTPRQTACQASLDSASCYRCRSSSLVRTEGFGGDEDLIVCTVAEGEVVAVEIARQVAVVGGCRRGSRG